MRKIITIVITHDETCVTFVKIFERNYALYIKTFTLYHHVVIIVMNLI